MLRSLLALPVLVSSVYALVFNTLVFKPRATSQPEHGDLLFPPDPTPAAVALPELLRRDTAVTGYVAPDNTCGYISGLSGAEYGCFQGTDRCVFFTVTSSYGSLGCCGAEGCNVVTTCVDLFHYNQCDNGCQKDSNTLKCTSSDYPYCNSVQFPQESIEDYFCDATSVSSWQIAYTTWIGEIDGRSFDYVTTTFTRAGEKSGAAASSSNTDSTTSSSHPTTTKSSSTTPTTSGPSALGGFGSQAATSPASSSTSSGSSTPIGAIVGGAVGGFAILAIVGVLIFFIVQRNKKNANAVNTVQKPVQQPTYAPPPNPNNSTSMAAASMAAAAGNLPTAQGPIEYYGSKPQEPYQQPPMSQQPPPQQYPSAPQIPGLQDGNLYTLPPAQQVWSSSPTNSGQSPNPAYSMSTGMPTSPNSQTHLTASYHDPQNGNSPTMSQAQRDSSFISTPNSPMPAYAPYRPPQPGASEMSANMSSGPFAQDPHQEAFEVPGSEAYRPQGSD